MSGLVRPKFSEGQILGAADLTALVVYDQQGAVYHENTEHLWGVAQGLTLTTKDSADSSGNKFVVVSLSPGRAVDRLGRSIVATASLPLDPADLKAAIGTTDKTKFYPVFVQAKDVDQPGDTQPGKCGATLVTRTEESLQIVYGNPGTEIGVLGTPPATVDHVFDTPALTDMVLVGWVQYDDTIQSGQFIAVNTTQANSASIRYVGVVASDVVAGGGVLTLHTRPDGQRFMLSLTEDSNGGCKLAFGKQDGTNPIVPAFNVDDKGNVNYTGTLTPVPVAKTLAESGVISDGARIRPPPTVTDDDITNGVRLHVTLTPYPQSPRMMLLPSGGLKLAFPLVTRCDVDVTDDSVVHSRVRWYDPALPSDSIDLPGLCNYLVIATGK
jgi:hypothetical protein